MCKYVNMYVCTYVRTYACMYVRTYVRTHVYRGDRGGLAQISLKFMFF